MNNVLVAGTGATILLFAITYEYMKVKKGLPPQLMKMILWFPEYLSGFINLLVNRL